MIWTRVTGCTFMLRIFYLRMTSTKNSTSAGIFLNVCDANATCLRAIDGKKIHDKAKQHFLTLSKNKFWRNKIVNNVDGVMNFKDNYRINWPNEILKPCWRVTEMEDWSEKTADSPIEIKWREITATLESSRSYIKSDTDLF